MNNMPVLLDTHVWLWLINGDDSLKSSECPDAIERAASDESVQVSAISVWEIGILESKEEFRFLKISWNGQRKH